MQCRAQYQCPCLDDSIDLPPSVYYRKASTHVYWLWEVHQACWCVINTNLFANRATQMYHVVCSFFSPFVCQDCLYLLNFLLLPLYKPLICKCIIAGFTVELRHSRKMHLALIQRATSPLCVISGHSGVQIKSSVARLQTHSFLRL